MTDPLATVNQSPEIHPHVDRGMSITKAAVITAVSTIVLIVSMYEVVKASLAERGLDAEERAPRLVVEQSARARR